MGDTHRVYWDACAWIALINQEKDRHNHLRRVYEQAQRGQIEIWTSAFTYAEVFKRNCGGTEQVGTYNADSANVDAMDDILTQDFIKRVNVDSIIGMKARALLQAHPKINKPQDGIHLATALYHNLDVLHTYDRSDLLVFDNMLGRRDGVKLRIRTPGESDYGPLFSPENKEDENQ